MLMIIGNGFDLYCGLKTTYKQFFEFRFNDNIFVDLQSCIEEYSNKKRLDVFDEYIEDYIYELFKEITVWDMIFMFERSFEEGQDWSDIERIIHDYIVNKKITLNSTRYSKNMIFDSVIESELLSRMIARMLFATQKKFSQLTFNSWLLDQLKLLENSFSTYVKLQIVNNVEYNRKAEILINKLYENDPSISLSLINFNYTIFDIRYSSSNNYKNRLLNNFTNVHGTVEEEIIFGIDEKDYESKKFLDPSKTMYLFTKTARKMFSFHEDKSFTLNPREASILIFGHSLNFQDYSYFQSIFDMYEIYSSDIMLIFAFVDYDKRRNIRVDWINRVITLIKRYGETMENQDHGGNLLHKLMLENRIEIVEVSNNLFF